MSTHAVVLISARRSAIGRVGGLHRSRRIEELSAPVLAAALDDACIAADRVEGLVLGNSTAGGNPARGIALAAGLSERAAATTIDSQCASGLEAILIAYRRIAMGDAGVLVAGGAESISTAPWRIARPRHPNQLPHFIGVEPATREATGDAHKFDASEALARQLNISREAQDEHALKSHLRAEVARDKRRFVGEILAIRSNPEDARDQSMTTPTADDLARLTAFVPPDGTLTPGNTSSLADAAAFTVLVSHKVWTELGRPPGLVLAGNAMLAASPEAEARALIAAFETMLGRLDRGRIADIGAVEMSEASAAQALAFVRLLNFDENVLNSDGGALVRGHPIAAAGTISVVRLFTRMIRSKETGRPRLGAACQNAIGGLGIAALFESVG